MELLKKDEIVTELKQRCKEKLELDVMKLKYNDLAKELHKAYIIIQFSNNYIYK